MLYTTLLTPVFYIWMLVKGKKLIITKYILVSLPFVLVHLSLGVNEKFYAQSYLLLFGVYIFSYTFYTFVNRYAQLNKIFDRIVIINFILTLFAILALSTSYKPVFWFVNKLSNEIGEFARLAMFTYEASYYSTLLVPVFSYYLLRVIFGEGNNRTLGYLLMVTLPLLLSFSVGVLAGLFLSVMILVIFNLNKLITKKYFLYPILVISSVLLFGLLFSFLFYRENALFIRLENILSGTDTSANGRTFEAFQLGYIIAELKSVWWGVGLGQIKVIGDEVIKTFYNYPPTVERVTIPCAMAETLAIFGIIGAAIRLFLEIFLFFKTNVLNNYYRTLLFFFIFIYHFTGSFITNIAEYVIWILAFSNVFPQFDIKPASGLPQTELLRK